MRLSRIFVSAGIGLAALALPSLAAAMPLTWTLTPGGTIAAYEDISRLMSIRSYATSNNNGSGAITSATTNFYSSGVGISAPGESTGSPQHALDNYGRDELLLIEFDDDLFNPATITLGWRSGDSDISYWVGGSGAGLDLTAACGGPCEISDLGGLGFSPRQDANNVPVNVAFNLTSGLTGRYLLIAGKLGDYNDYFKVKQVGGNSPDAPQISEPQTLILLATGLGLLAWGASRRTARTKRAA